MLNSAWLDIATGVVMVWFLFALMVSAINEGVVKILALRSKQLWAALAQLLDGSVSPQGILHSLIRLPTRVRPASPTATVNSSITDRLYATKTMQGLEIRSKPTQKTRIENIPASVFSHAFIEMTVGGGRAVVGAVEGAGGVDGTIAQVRGYLDSLPPGPLKAQMEAVLVGVGDDVTKFRDAVEHWFDGQMTRLSRLYRAQVHIILTIIGLGVAVASFGFGLQSDSLQLVSQLRNDQNVRTAVVGAATDAARGDLIKAGGCDPANTTDPAKCQLQGLAKLDKINFALSNPVPPGSSFLARIRYLVPWRHFYTLLGVVITGVAISFGSSFWFALLKRLVGLRGGSSGSG